MKLKLRISLIVIKLLARILRKQTLQMGEFGEDSSLFKEAESVCRRLAFRLASITSITTTPGKDSR